MSDLEKMLDRTPERNVIRYSFTPGTLQDISMVKAVTNLWDTDAGDQIADFCRSDYYNQKVGIGEDIRMDSKEWSELGKCMLRSVADLDLPKTLQIKLLKLVRPTSAAIVNWINFGNGHGLFKSEFHTRDLIWTPRATIDEKATAIKLLSDESQNIYARYQLACTFCLVEHLDTIIPKIDQNVYLDEKNIDVERRPMVYYWTWFITKDDRLEKMSPTHESINEYVFKLVVRSGPDAAVRYMWSQLNDEEKERNLIRATSQSMNADSVCFFLSLMNEKQWKEVFLEDNSRRILMVLLSSWRWQDYFLPTLQKVYGIMHGETFFFLWHIIVGTHKYRPVFERWWECAPNRFKMYVFENHDSFVAELFRSETADLVLLMLASASTLQKKELISCAIGMERCYKLFVAKQWDLFDVFVKRTLLCEKDVGEFMERFVREKGSKICFCFVDKHEWDALDEFANRCLKSEVEKCRFKRQLAFEKATAFKEKNSHINLFKRMLSTALFESTKADFTNLDKFLGWCFENDSEGIDQFKKSLFENNLLVSYDLIRHLIRKGFWEKLDATLDWCFRDPNDVLKFKSGLLSPEFEFRTIGLIGDLICKNDQLKSLEKFVGWKFSSDKVDRCKREIFKLDDRTLRICADLLRQDKWELVDEFINWFCSGVAKFKKELLFSRWMDNVYMKYGSKWTHCGKYEHERYEFKTIVTWFNPCVETIALFKQKCAATNWFEAAEAAFDGKT